jgi:Pyruvate/2-oxoacid:ferredoxin oxidoreductase delta subunit
MKITGQVTETLIIQKEVEVEVPDNATDEQVKEAIRAKANEKTILSGNHGWEGIESFGQDIEIQCKYCGQYCNDGCDEAQAGGFDEEDKDRRRGTFGPEYAGEKF